MMACGPLPYFLHDMCKLVGREVRIFEQCYFLCFVEKPIFKGYYNAMFFVGKHPPVGMSAALLDDILAHD